VVLQYVIGYAQAKAYCAENSIPFAPRKSRLTFSFGDRTFQSLGTIPVLVPTPGSTIRLVVDIVRPDVPLLICLDNLDIHGLQILSVTNQLECAKENWRMPIERKIGQAYITWPPLLRILYSRNALNKMHRHFMHPSADKLLRLLKRARPDELPHIPSVFFKI
jgi:hypothetical protein